MAAESRFPAHKQTPAASEHRCNQRLEDLVEALFAGDFAGKVVPAFGNLRRCVAAEPGQEPADPYLVLLQPQPETPPASDAPPPPPPPARRWRWWS